MQKQKIQILNINDRLSLQKTLLNIFFSHFLLKIHSPKLAESILKFT